jgi:hypothetical protein
VFNILREAERWTRGSWDFDVGALYVRLCSGDNGDLIRVCRGLARENIAQ